MVLDHKKVFFNKKHFTQINLQIIFYNYDVDKDGFINLDDLKEIMKR